LQFLLELANEKTIDQDKLEDYFEIIKISTETNLYQPEEKMKVFIVTISSCDGASLFSATVHLTEESALKAWNILRLDLLKEAEDLRDDILKDSVTGLISMYQDMIDNLKNTDPKTINNYPQDCPIIVEKEVTE
jgi:hypothetical protein